MGFSFNETDIKRFNEIFGQEPELFGNSWVWSLRNDVFDKPMIISIMNDVEFGEEVFGSMVSVQTRHGYYELHNLTGFLVFEPDEIIFVCSKKKTVSCLIVGRGNTCSFYGNIRKELLLKDFADIDSSVLLSAMQLSIVQNII